MEKLMQQITREERELNRTMENDDYVNPDMLDKALSLSMNKSRLITELQRELLKALDYIEDMHILETVKAREENDNGARYTLDEVKQLIKDKRE